MRSQFTSVKFNFIDTFYKCQYRHHSERHLKFRPTGHSSNLFRSAVHYFKIHALWFLILKWFFVQKTSKWCIMIKRPRVNNLSCVVTNNASICLMKQVFLYIKFKLFISPFICARFILLKAFERNWTNLLQWLSKVRRFLFYEVRKLRNIYNLKNKIKLNVLAT